ncbi:MAG: hypothetical protein ACMG6E_00010 [Candidatus Roizmanbacteria bacterium]
MLDQGKIKSAILSSGVLQKGHFVFADGNHALIKLEMDSLWDFPENLDIILSALATVEGLPKADMILGVPTGGQRLAQEIGKRFLDIPVILLERIPGMSKQDFRFVSEKDEKLALNSQSIRIYEDVVTTLRSIAGVVKLLDPKRQDICSLAIWKRGETKKKYQKGVTDHYLIKEYLPSFLPHLCPICGTPKDNKKDKVVLI